MSTMSTTEAATATTSTTATTATSPTTRATPPTETAPLVELRDVGRVFGDAPPVVALRSVDLVVHHGDFVAVVGRSGSGKSTLLNTLGLMDTPTSGTYLLDGFDTMSLGAAERARLRGARIGFVFQSFHLIASRSVVDNVAMAGMYGHTSRRDRRAAAHEMLGRVGLADRADASPAVLSGGERQRVAIARALAARPALLLADEPTGNLDSANAAGILDLFLELHAGGTTIVMITHDHAVAASARRQVVMTDGVLRG